MMNSMHDKVYISNNFEIWQITLGMKNKSMDQILGQCEGENTQ